MGTVRRSAAVVAAAIAFVLSGQTQASAGVQWAVDPWGQLCSSPYDNLCTHGAQGGSVVWGQRTAEVSGLMWNDDTNVSTYTKIYVEGFAGAVKVDSETRTVNNGERPFRFPVGDPDRVGGMDRIRIQVCVHFPEEPYKECSGQLNEIRD